MNYKRWLATGLHRLASLFERENNTPPIPVPETPDKTTQFATDCTYQAAWLMTKGATFIRLRKRELSRNQQEKKGYREEWTVYLDNVPLRAIAVLQSGDAQVKLDAIKRERRRLKRYIRSYLSVNYGKKRGYQGINPKNHVGYRKTSRMGCQPEEDFGYGDDPVEVADKEVGAV